MPDCEQLSNRFGYEAESVAGGLGDTAEGGDGWCSAAALDVGDEGLANAHTVGQFGLADAETKLAGWAGHLSPAEQQAVSQALTDVLGLRFG